MGVHVAKIDVALVDSSPLDLIIKAWQFSRPADTTSTLEDIAKVDLPVLEFANIQVQMFAPILLREYVCTSRDHKVWARTSRVDDLTDWPVYAKSVTVQALFNKCQEDFKTMHQDQARMSLPLGYMTRFSANYTFRDYFNLARCVRDEAFRYSESDPLISTMFSEFFGALLDAVAFVPDNIRVPMLAKKTKPIVGEYLGRYGKHSEKLGAFVVVSSDGFPIALRAQLVRHRPAMVDDNLRSFFTDADLSTPISEKMNGSFCLREEDALHLITTRDCWIAQEGLWADFLYQIRQALGSNVHPLPCDDGSCPYARDNLLRLEGKDPAPPCPMYAILNKQPLTGAQRDAGMKYVNTRSDYYQWNEIFAKEGNENAA